MSKSLAIILDPGHGMGNRKPGVYDPGTVHKNGLTEAEVAMTWANELRDILRAAGHRVVRTRKDAQDGAHVGQRARIAKEWGGDIMLSIHVNSGGGTGVECFYRGETHRPTAAALSAACAKALVLKDRGPKTESASQHRKLAVMAFQPCFLLEVGFMDRPSDVTGFTNPTLRKAACQALATVLENHVKPR